MFTVGTEVKVNGGVLKSVRTITLLDSNTLTEPAPMVKIESFESMPIKRGDVVDLSIFQNGRFSIDGNYLVVETAVYFRINDLVTYAATLKREEKS